MQKHTRCETVSISAQPLPSEAGAVLFLEGKAVSGLRTLYRNSYRLPELSAVFVQCDFAEFLDYDSNDCSDAGRRIDAGIFEA